MRRAARLVVRGLVATVAGLVAIVVVALLVARGAAAMRERTPREALMPSAGRLVPAGDVRLFLQEARPPETVALGAPVVVFLHGTGAWGEIWRPIMTAVAAAGHRAIAVDLPPFGFSDRSPTADYTPEAQARRLWAALDTLGIDSVMLVGHSFGARATLAAALMREAQVSRLVLIDAALGLADTSGAPPPPSPAPLRWTLATTPLRNALVAATMTNPMMTRRLTGMLVANPKQLSDAQIAMLQHPLSQPRTTRDESAWLPGFIFSPPPPVAATRHALAAFPAPVHFIWGELDSLTPVTDGQDLARLVRCATWDLLPGVGHIPSLEAPDTLARIIVARLSASSRPDAASSCTGS